MRDAMNIAPCRCGREGFFFILGATSSILLGLATGLALDSIPVAAAEPVQGQPNQVDSEIGKLLREVEGAQGICVVAGPRALEVAMPLARQTKLLVYAQIPDAAAVARARRSAHAAGLYGHRLFIEQGPSSAIHLADNVADLLIAYPNETEIPEAEALRVLHPQGKAIVGSRRIVKPFPEGLDDWSHPYHGPDNNPQSNDRLIRAPYLTQFLAKPYYAPLPQVATASAGRLFKAYGHIAFKPREERLLNRLVAYNGYNGTELWQHKLTPGLMIHRNTMIATPEILYLGDDRSCKLLDTATGAVTDEITPPTEIAGGTFWKWMALEDGILYALLGQEEQRDPVIRLKREAHGWPWNPLSPGFNQKSNPWGFGRNLLALDPKTKRVLWHYHEQEPIDSRGLCMKNGKIYFFRFGSYLGCIDARSGKPLWRKTPEQDPKLFQSIGPDLNRQSWETNWRTAAYLKCSDQALYLAGPMFNQLLAISAADGSVMWSNDYNNYQLVLRTDALYAISGPWGKIASKKLDPLTGADLGDLAIARRACARPSGAADALFFRAQGGSVRLDIANNRPQWISPMRAQCHDGVMIANGLLTWWPSVCDCQLTLYGMTALGPAGRFDFAAKATESERLERAQPSAAPAPADLARFTPTRGDWPTFRGDNTGQAISPAAIKPASRQLWQWTCPNGSQPTAPVVVGDRTFVANADGVVRALDNSTGKELWNAFTGGPIRMPPTIWKGRVYVGSGDGWVYAFDAGQGDLAWRFRAAPTERKIPVYDTLQSTWPATSGVLIEAGIAYVAAGIVNYDGTYLYALDAETGTIHWQNTTSGHLDPEARTGVSVQGQMLLHRGKLYLAGGTSISPAIYDIKDGQCLNDPTQLKECASIYPRGWELSLFGDHVFACGQPWYKAPEHQVHDPSALEKVFLSRTGDRDIFWANNERIVCSRPIDSRQLNESLAARQRNFMIPSWGELKFNEKPLWQWECPDSRAIATCADGVLVATGAEVTALDIEKGTMLWRQPLPAAPVPWGIAVDRNGKVVVTLENGQLLGFGP
jgi:outer membrane protein assembly factor BamB